MKSAAQLHGVCTICGAPREVVEKNGPGYVFEAIVCPNGHLQLHEEEVADRRGRLAQFLDRHGLHRHYAVRRTWTLEDSPWATDRYALDYCACGATRHMWGGEWTA